MRKLILFTLAAMVLMSGAAMATETRVRSLGIYSAPYICDDYNIWTWYATLPSYSNLVIMTMWNGEDFFEYDDEFDSDYHEYGWEELAAYYAMTYALGDEGSWGTLMMQFTQNQPSPNMNTWIPYEVYGDWWDENDIIEHEDCLTSKWVLGWGKAMEDMSFGLFFSRASEWYKYTDDDATGYTDEYKHSYTTIGAGFKMAVTEDMTGEIAFDYTMVGKTYEYTDDQDSDNSYKDELDPGKIIDIRARVGYDWKEDIKLIGYLNWATKDFAIAYGTDGPFDYGYKEMDFTFGLGANLNVNDDNMILVAIEPFSYMKFEPSGYDDGDTAEWHVAYRAMPRFIMALESDLTDWLTFRTGFSKDLGKITYEWSDTDDTETEEYTNWCDDPWTEFVWNIGLGFHFGDFDIDCLVNPGTAFSMGHWLTGYQPHQSDEVTPIGMISAVYHF